MPDEVSRSNDPVTDGLVVVLWSPGVSRELAHRLIAMQGLASLGFPRGEAQVVNHCGSCGSSSHGRPVLVGCSKGSDVHVSVSYAADMTTVALTEVGPVGVDVERRGAASSTGFDAVVRHTDEPPTDHHGSTVTWVRKESLLKATGQGLRVDPRQIRLTEPDQPPELITWEASSRPAGRVWMFDVEITPEHVAAVTVLGGGHRPPLAVSRGDLEGPAAQPGRASR
jgi:4'-phosphopantetheinyl transferase